MDILTEIVKILVGGIVELGKGIGSGLSQCVTSMFLNAEGTGLSTFGTIVVVFAGVSLAVGLTQKVYCLLTQSI